MAGMQPLRLTSPRGRFVQGDAFEAQTTDAQGAPLTIKTGPNAGQPTKRWFMAMAYAKNDPETLPYLMQIAQYAAQAWPSYFPSGAAQSPPLFGCTHPRFSLKIMDGDGVDDNGKPNRDKPGFAGHFIVKYSTSIKAPGVWQEPNFAEMEQITDPRAFPRGYYGRINHTIQSNDNDQRPGLYVNLDKVAISANQAGAEIIQSGPTAAEAFGGASTPAAPAAAAPAGGLIAKPGVDLDAYRKAGWTDDLLVQHGHATRAAPAPLPASPPPVPGVPTPAASTPPVPGAAPATPSPSNPVPPPYDGYMATGAAAPPPAAPAAPVRTMLPPANGATYEAMIAAGWTDAMLVQHGMMAP